MNRFLSAALTFAALLWTYGCSQATAPPVADTRAADLKALSDTEAMMSKDVAAKNWEKLASYYAEDAVLMSPEAPAAVGTEAIKGLGKMMADSQADLNFHANKVDVAKSGEIGYTQGAYTLTMTDPKTKKVMSEKGNYVTVYKKQADGSWKIVQDINTPDAEPTSK
jgi:uncharacterized protein (TIGR02246 family)